MTSERLTLSSKESNLRREESEIASDPLQEIQRLTNEKRISWKKHALRRMFERGFVREQVFQALTGCTVVEQHELQRPLPTWLVLGYYEGRPLHVVLAFDGAEKLLWIITVYEPSFDEWHEDFMTRRQP